MSRSDADYVANVDHYLEQTDRVTESVQKTRETFLRLLPKGASTVISIGEGFGRDIKFFREQGLRAIGTDGSKEMVNKATQYLGTSKDFYTVVAQDFNLASVGLDRPVDGIWAMASLHHVPQHELKSVFEHLRDALNVGGIVHASFIMGVGTVGQPEVAIQRFWSRVTVDELIKTVKTIDDFEIIDESGRSSNDFFSNVPSEGFHFYNLWLRRKLSTL